MALLERVNIVPCYGIINRIKSILYNYVATNNLGLDNNIIYVEKILTKIIILKMLVYYSNSFGVNLMHDDNTINVDRYHVDKIMSIAKIDLESTFWHICRELIEYDNGYIDITIIGNNMHIYVCKVKG